MKEHGVPESRLTVIEKIRTSKHDGIIYKCQCECDNECEVPRWRLKNENIKSCGCQKKMHQLIKNKDNLVGNKFGRLTVQYRNMDNGKQHCICECGNEVELENSVLISGNTKSCGCLQKDKNQPILHLDLMITKTEQTAMMSDVFLEQKEK